MSENYPKSREELQAEVMALTSRVTIAEADSASLRAALSRSEAERAYLTRRRGLRKLDPNAKDSFQRPFR